MFMQAGFALVETGLCRAKNAAHTMSMNFLVYALGMTGFFICGFAFMCGGANGTASAARRRSAALPTLNQMVTIGRVDGDTAGASSAPPASSSPATPMTRARSSGSCS